MRLVIQFDCDSRRQSGIADHEIDVTRFDVLEIRFPPQMPFIGLNQIGQSDFWEDELLADDPPQNIEKAPFGYAEQIFPPKEGFEGNIHSVAREKQTICPTR